MHRARRPGSSNDLISCECLDAAALHTFSLIVIIFGVSDDAFVVDDDNLLIMLTSAAVVERDDTSCIIKARALKQMRNRMRLDIAAAIFLLHVQHHRNIIKTKK